MAPPRERKAPTATASAALNDGREAQPKAPPPRPAPIIVEPPPPPERVADRMPAHTAPEHLRPASHDTANRDAERPAPRVRTRSRKGAFFENPYNLPMDEIPPDLSYEWKRFTNSGQDDPFYLAQMRMQGWEPVPPSRHPNWVPEGYDKPHIIKAGLILMDRPKELTLEARQENYQMANQQMRDAEVRLGMTGVGEATRDLAEVRPKVHKEFMRPVPITGEE